MDSKGSTSQVIDQNLIDLLGLQDEYELSWEDYFRALREASIAARMSDTKYTSDQAKLITDELKRVKQEDKSTKFSTGVKEKKKKVKVNPNKITAISTFVQKQTKTPDQKIRPVKGLLPPSEEKQKTQNLLPPAEKIIPQEKKKEERISLLKILQNIDKTLGSILKTLESGLKFDQKSEEENRKNRERSRRGETENRLEGGLGKGLKTIIGAASKALSPLQEVFDRIKNFIVWVLLGKAFRMFVHWFNDPNNQKTFNTIVKFLGDHWLLLVGSYLMFGNSIGRMVTKFIGKLAVFTVKMGVVIARKLLPLIGKLGGKGKLGLAVAGGLAVAAGARALTSGGNKSSEIEKPSKEETTPAPKPQTPSTSGFDKGGIVNSFDIKISEEKEKKGKKEKSISDILPYILGGPAYLPFGLAKQGLENFDSIKESGMNVANKAASFSPALLLAKKFGLFGNENKEKKSVEKFESGGVVKGKEKGKSLSGLNLLGKAFEYSPLGLGFKVGKAGLKNAGKVASGVAGVAGKALEYSPLGLAFKAGKLGSETFGKTLKGAASLTGKGIETGGKLLKSGVENTLKLSTLPISSALSGLQGASDILKNGILKSKEVQSQLNDVFDKAKESGILQDPKLLALGGIPGLIKLVADKTKPQVKKNANETVKTGGFNLGGVVEKINSGLSITGAGKDNTLIKAKTGDAILTENDQKLLSSAIKSGGQLPLDTKQNNSPSKVGKETTIAVRKGEALVTPEQQKSLFQKFGINIPKLLSGRKPNKIDSDRIKTKSGKGFANGGIVSGFASGGIVGGDAAFVNQRYQEILQTTDKSKIQKYNAKHGEGAYEKNLLVRLNRANAPEKSKLPPLKTTSKYDLENRNKAKKGGTETLSINGIRIPGGGQALKRLKNAKTSDLNVEGLVSGAKSKLKNLASSSGIGQGQLTAEQKRKIAQEKSERDKIIQQGQKRRSADDGIRKEWTKAFNDPTHPMHDKVTWDESYNFAKFKKDYLAKQTKAPAKGKQGYTPFKSKFAGARDAAHAKAKNITGESKKGFGLGRLLKKGAKGALGLLGTSIKNTLEYGPLGLAAKVGKRGLEGASGIASALGNFSLNRFNQVSKDLNTKPKQTRFTGVKSSDFYQANSQEREKSLSKLSSQQRLNTLSREGGGVRSGGKGRRHIAEMKAREREWQGRGGTFGAIKRGFQSFFGNANAQIKNLEADKASAARVRQAGAASIGRYYSSSDGKYYKDYAAAERARQARAAAPKPPPKPAFVKSSGSSSRTGLSKPVGAKPSPPKPIIAKPKPVGTGGGGLSKPRGGVKKKQGGGLVSPDLGLKISPVKTDYNFKPSENKNTVSTAFNSNINLNPEKPKRQSIADSLKEIREMRARSLDRQGDALEAVKLRASNYSFPKFDSSKLSVDTNKAFNSNLNLNINTPKISTPGGSKGIKSPFVGFDRSWASRRNRSENKRRKINQRTERQMVMAKELINVAPIETIPDLNKNFGFEELARERLRKAGSGRRGIQLLQGGGSVKRKVPGMKGGGIVKKIGNAIGGFFNKNRKRDIVKKGVQKTTAKGDKIKSGFSELTGKRGSSQKKGGFWSGVYDKLSGVNTAINTGKGFLKALPKNTLNLGKSAIKKVASNPRAIKAGLALSKYGGRMIPGLGIATSAAESASRAEKGDKLGAALAGIGAASGATTLATSGASLTGIGAAVPAVAEAVSMVADTALLGKDLFDIAVSPSEVSKKSIQSKAPSESIDTKKIMSKKFKVQSRQGGGLINMSNSGINIQNPEKFYQNQLNSMLQSRFGLNSSSPFSPSVQENTEDPFQQFGSGLKELGQRARNIFSPITNLFGGGQGEQPQQTSSAVPMAPQPLAVPSAPPPPPVFNLPPPPPLPPLPQTTSVPSAPKAPIKKSIMQQQADELRAMRASSLERQGRKAESYGLNAFGTGKDFSSFFTKGMVMENTGMNMPGGTADRQLTALQPGEYVVPKDTVDRMGKGFLDSIVGSTDSNSAAAKIGVKSNNVGDKIKPYSATGAGKPSMVKLPPIKEGDPGGSAASGQSTSSKEIKFDAQCANKSATTERKRILDTLGFINHI